MISRKLLYLVPASLSPDQARKNPMVPNPRATIARRMCSGSLTPIAVNEIAREWMLSALAAIEPIAMASRVRSASQVGKTLTKAAVGLAPAPAATLGMVPAAAPTVSSTRQERNRPSPAHRAMARLLVSGLK